MKKGLIIYVLLLILLFSIIPGFTGASGGHWGIDGLRYRAKIVVSTLGLNYSVEDLLIPLNITSDIIDFSKTSPSGDDIVITSIDGEVIPFYVEYWSASDGKGVIWIKPSEYNGSMQLYIYYNVIGANVKLPNYTSPWSNYFLSILFNKKELFYVKNKPYIRDKPLGDHVAKIVGPGYTIAEAPTGEAVYLDGEKAWVMVTNTSFYNWSSITIEALLYIYNEQTRYGHHRDLSYGNYIAAPFASIYILYGENKTNPNITLYFNTWHIGTGKKEYKVNLTRYKGKWIYLVIIYDNSTREYSVYVNGEKIYNTTIPRDEVTILDVNPHKWDPYGTKYLSIGLGANNIGFERTRVAYDFLRILKNKTVSSKWVRAEYLALINTSLKLLGVEENEETIPSISVPKTLVFGVVLVLVVSAIYMLYNRYAGRKQ